MISASSDLFSVYVVSPNLNQVILESKKTITIIILCRVFFPVDHYPTQLHALPDLFTPLTLAIFSRPWKRGRGNGNIFIPGCLVFCFFTLTQLALFESSKV